MIKSEIREEYLKGPLPLRLGGLAADLSRIVSFSDNPKSAPVVASLLEESCWFIEWTAPELTPDRAEDAAYLVDVQRALARWQHVWQSAQSDPAERARLAEQAREWSIEILYLSGLVDE